MLTCNPEAGMFEAFVTEYMMKLFEQRHGKVLTNRLRQDTRAVWKLKREVERAISKLSSAELAYVTVESFIDGLDFSEALNGARFEKLTEDIVEESLQTLRDTLVHKMEYKIHEIIIFGGSSLNPKVREKILTYFEISESKVNFDVDKLSVIGAAVHAARLFGSSAGQTESGVLGYSAADTCSIGIGYKGFETLGEPFVGLISRDKLPAKAARTVNIRSGKDGMASSTELEVFEGSYSSLPFGAYIGDVSFEFPQSHGVVISKVELIFRMDDTFVLTVELVEMEYRLRKSAAFDHRLSQSERAKMRSRLNALDNTDRTEARRVQASDELESLAYLMRRQSVSGKAGLIRQTALEVIEWLDRNRDAATYDFIKMKKLLTNFQLVYQ